jgi:UDP-glucuronate decarboxylase
LSKRVLVTGGAGFIGTHLCAELLSQGHQVVCADNFLSGTRDNVAQFRNHSRFELIEHDVTVPMTVQVDEIYNLACPASPPQYRKDPVRTIRTSVMGAIQMLELAQRLDIPVLQASTSEVYGDPEVHPQTEEYWGNVNPIGPRSCYDEGKRCAETLFFDFHRQYDVAIKVVRIFNTYGPRMLPDDGRVVSNFIVQALRGDDITIFGDGSQTRSFCYVDDLVAGLTATMAAAPEVTGPINLGNPVEMSILELAKLILRLTKSRSRLKFRDVPMDDPRRRRPDIGKARSLLAWEPKVEIVAGLERTIAWFHSLTPTNSAIPRH